MAVIKKGTKLRVIHHRLGPFDAIATADFDTETDEWYALALDQDKPVFGQLSSWERGAEIPTRKGKSRVELRG